MLLAMNPLCLYFLYNSVQKGELSNFYSIMYKKIGYKGRSNLS